MSTVSVKDSGKKSDGTLSMVIMIVAVLLSLAVIAGVIVTRTAFHRMFDEFGINGPLLTKLALSPYLLLSLVLGAGIVIAKEFVVSDKRLTLYINLFFCLAAFLALGIYVSGLFLPLIRMTQAVS